MRRAVRDADAAGDTERVRELIEVMREHELPIDETLAAIAVRAERPTDADPQVVGAVLSLSGRGRKVGELALRGLMLAAGLPLEGPPEPGAPQLVFRDDGGDPERAVAAVEELVAVHRVVAIIGPMDARAAEAAAARAEELGVPLLSLSPARRRRAAVVDGLPHVRHARARSCARCSPQAKTQGRTRVAALLPRGRLRRPDGEPAARARPRRSPSSIVDRAALRAGDHVVRRARRRRSPSRTSTRCCSPTAPEHVTLIAPALAAAGLWCGKPGAQAPQGGRAIGILAPAVAFDPGLARRVGRYLQGAVFSVQFDAEVAQGAARSFADRFQAQFSEPPDAFAALAYDAYKLVRAAVDRRRPQPQGAWPTRCRASRAPISPARARPIEEPRAAQRDAPAAPWSAKPSPRSSSSVARATGAAASARRRWRPGRPRRAPSCRGWARSGTTLARDAVVARQVELGQGRLAALLLGFALRATCVGGATSAAAAGAAAGAGAGPPACGAG